MTPKIQLALTLSLLSAVGCGGGDDIDPDPVPGPVWNETVRYTCPTPGGVEYLYVCPGGGTSCPPGVAHPSLIGCTSVSAPYPWQQDPETLDAWLGGLAVACELDCVEQVNEQAADLGRDVITNDCGGAVTEATYTLQNCAVEAMGAPRTQELELTWTPAVGSPVTAAATARYALSAGRPQVLRLVSLAVAPFEVATGSADATALLGYPSGTRIAVTELQLEGIDDVSLSAANTGRIPAGAARIVASIEVTEPGGSPARSEIRGTNPWDIGVSHGRAGLAVVPVDDTLGGTLTAR
jgi:hypothetical protein